MTNRREPLFLFVVDIGLFLAALWLTLLLRYLVVPSFNTWYNHFVPFSLLFLVWVLIFFIAGLYDKHTTLFRGRMPTIILNAQAINITIAALFFFFVPNFGVAPKTSLGIYLIVSSALILFWRLYIFPRLVVKKQQRAILIAAGEEMEELHAEVNRDARHPFFFVAFINPTSRRTADLVRKIRHLVTKERITIVVIETLDEKVVKALPELYDLVFSGVRFIDAGRAYEEVFDREPLSLLKHQWLVENISTAPQAAYDFGKRVIDITVASFLGLLTLLAYPFIALAIKLDDRGTVFISQERIGKGGALIRIVKFRSMEVEGSEKVTRVGRALRASRLDELPQLLSVVQGRQSLIGPRPELPRYAELYAKRIPYYHIRHLIKPGLSGWAQIQEIRPPKFGVEYDATERKLSYDLFYIKHRSLWLDIKISLKTVRILLLRSGI